MTELNQKQLVALREFAATKGRAWKSKLRLAWEQAPWDLSVELVQVRNQFGPSWLAGFRLK